MSSPIQSNSQISTQSNSIDYKKWACRGAMIAGIALIVLAHTHTIPLGVGCAIGGTSVALGAVGGLINLPNKLKQHQSEYNRVFLNHWLKEESIHVVKPGPYPQTHTNRTNPPATSPALGTINENSDIY